MAYSAIEPFGSQWEELLHGIRCMLLVAPHVKEGSPPPEPTDYMPSWQEQEMEWEAIQRNLSLWKTIS